MNRLAKPALPLLAVALIALACWQTHRMVLPHPESISAIGESNRRLRPECPIAGQPVTSVSAARSATVSPRQADIIRPPAASVDSNRHTGIQTQAGHSSHLANGTARSSTPFISRRSAPRSPASPAPGPYETPQPAAWVDMGDFAVPDPLRDAALQTEAERLLPLLTASDLDPETPSGISARREVVAASDLWFRQRYGGRQWLQHHIQAHHMAAAAQK